MSTTAERTRKRLFFKIYSESESRHIIPGSPRALELCDALARDDIRKIYIIAPNRAVSMPYVALFRAEVPGVTVRDLFVDKLEKRHAHTVKSIIDDINSAIQEGQSCEIIFFNSGIAALFLACFHANASRSVSRSMEQVRKIAPNTIFSGSDIAFINHFTDLVTGGGRDAEEPFAEFLEPRRETGAGPRTAPESPPEGPGVVPAQPAAAGPAAAARAEAGVVPVREGGTAVEQPGVIVPPPNLLLRFRIGTKLLALVGTIVAFALSVMIVIGTLSYRNDSEAKQRSSNTAVAQMLGERLEDELVAALAKARVAAEFSSSGKSARLAEKAGGLLFRDRSNLIFMGVVKKSRKDLDFGRTFLNREYLNENQVLKKDLREIHAKNAPYFLESFRNRVVVRNISPDMGLPVMGISFPYESGDGGVRSIILCYMPLDRFIAALGTAGDAHTFMVSDQGDCVAHPERNRVLSRVNMTHVPIVRRMLASTMDRGEMRYRDRDGRYYLGSFRKLDMFGLGVVTAAAEDSVFREVKRIQLRNFAVLGVMLVIALLSSFLFSRTISVPIESLRQLTAASPIGGLALSAPAQGDEVYFLTTSFREVYSSYLESRKHPSAPPPGPLPAPEEPPVAERFAEPAGAGDRAEGRMSQQFMAEGLRIQVTYAGPDVTMSWVGRASLANPSELLNPYLEGVINSLRGRVLTCDFSTLETMNAAMVQSIIRFAQALDENRIQATFLYNKSIDWQDAAFEALGAVIQDMTTIGLDGRIIEKNVFMMK